MERTYYRTIKSNKGLVPMPYGEFSAMVTAARTGSHEGAKNVARRLGYELEISIRR